jgi:O-antigen/teichoic acid export membrane protein
VITSAPRSLGARLRGPASWGLADQGLSSLTNFGLTFFAARSLGPAAFGGFALAFAAYLLTLGLSRALTSEPLSVRFSAVSAEDWRSGTRLATGSAVLVGTVGGLLMVFSGSIWGGTAGHALLAMGVFLPGLLLQDAWRFAFFAAGRGAWAAANDGVWALLLAVTIAFSLGVTRPTAVWFAAAWGATGTAAGLVGVLQARLLPQPQKVRAWWRLQRDLAPRFAAEFLTYFGSGQAALYAIGGIAGLAAVGAIRAAQVLLGPLNVIFMGTSLFAVPEASRRARHALPTLRGLGLRISVGLGLGVAGWAGAVALLPGRVGQLIMDDAWLVARPLLLPAAILMVGAGVVSGAATVLRGLADARRSLRARALQGALVLAGAVIGATFGGASGAAWGLGISVWAAAGIWWKVTVDGLRAGPTPTRVKAARVGPDPIESFSSG